MDCLKRQLVSQEHNRYIQHKAKCKQNVPSAKTRRYRYRAKQHENHVAFHRFYPSYLQKILLCYHSLVDDTMDENGDALISWWRKDRLKEFVYGRKRITLILMEGGIRQFSDKNPGLTPGILLSGLNPGFSKTRGWARVFGAVTKRYTYARVWAKRSWLTLSMPCQWILQ